MSRKTITKSPEGDFLKKYNDLQEIQARAAIEQKLILQKALGSNNVDDLLKANLIYNQLQGNGPTQQQNNFSDRKSYLIDPYNLYENLGYKEKPFAVTYNTLRSMAKAPITKATIKTRIEQTTQFSEVQDDEQRFGWMVRKKKITDRKKLDDDDKRTIDYITSFISEGGNIGDNWNADDFNDFLRKIVPDTLTLDQMTFEVREDNFGRPIEYFATDGATYRLAKQISSNNIKDNNGLISYYPKYVQILNSQIYNEFYPWELCFGIRNPSTDIYTNGYGRSELEDMIKVITWMLYGDQYNGKFFSQGAAPKGIIRLSGNVNDGRLAEFKQQWQAQIAGVQNAWKTPILEADKMEFLNLQMSNQDMQFSKWQEYLIKLHSALYTIDPSEIGFAMGGSSENPQYEADRKYKLQFSQEKGLFPLLKFIQRKINKYLVNRINPNFEFIFTGIDQEDEAKSLDNDIKKLSNFMGYKEIRKKNGLPPELPKDDMIFNGIYYQMKQSENQMAMMGMGQQNPEENPFARDNNENPFEQQGEDKENPFHKETKENPFKLNDLEENPYAKDNENNPFMKGFNEWLDILIESDKN